MEVGNSSPWKKGPKFSPVTAYIGIAYLAILSATFILFLLWCSQ